MIAGRLRIPSGIGSLEAFSRWVTSEDCPEKLRVAWLAGTLWVDMTMEQLYTHNQVKGECGRVLATVVRTLNVGMYIPDGMHLRNPGADLSTIPDGLFISYDAFRSGRVRQVAGARAGVVELEGSPEMVLEVVSESSLEKDTVTLPVLYHRAGVNEFWRIDARGELRFEILHRTESGYVPAEEADGWWRSAVFGRWFRMTQQPDLLGQPQFTLAIRDAAATP
jgi:Uma2 family endonuclease